MSWSTEITDSGLGLGVTGLRLSISDTCMCIRVFIGVIIEGLYKDNGK